MVALLKMFSYLWLKYEFKAKFKLSRISWYLLNKINDNYKKQRESYLICKLL